MRLVCHFFEMTPTACAGILLPLAEDVTENGFRCFREFRRIVEARVDIGADCVEGTERGRFGGGTPNAAVVVRFVADDSGMGLFKPNEPNCESNTFRFLSSSRIHSVRPRSHISLASSLTSSSLTRSSSFGSANLSRTLSSSSRIRLSTFFISRNERRSLDESLYGSWFRRSESSASDERRGLITLLRFDSAAVVLSTDAKASVTPEELAFVSERGWKNQSIL